ncbi:MAG TPA: hypothetical protein VFF82_09490 [Rhodocyclaceae bacterium]|nr:hypothetical protein [Rhodocyclaceae bacterium]
MRLSVFFMCLAAAALTACSEDHSLSVADKAKFTAELIAERPECAQYWKQLSAPVADENLIKQTYLAAKAAYCLKPDV